MNIYKADLHIHTVLSPCGDLEMSPRAILDMCVLKQLDIIGITDHNSTLQCPVMVEAGNEKGITVLPGVELNTSEEVHLLAYFKDLSVLPTFQEWIDAHLPVINNRPDLFGHQVVVDLDENILLEEKRLLITALSAGIDETIREVKSLGGMVIPAHIGKGKNSLFSQLGFIPKNLSVDAMETSGEKNHRMLLSRCPELSALPFIYGSDAHYLEDIGKHYTLFEMEHKGFQEIVLALSGEKNRRIIH